MYGLVNKAIQDLIRTRFGEETWNSVKTTANVNVPVFVGMSAYRDELTHSLVLGASRVLGRSVDEVLELLGEHWTLYTAQEGYGEMLNLAGRTLPEFLQNLDHLHARVGLLFPQLSPPAFRCIDLGNGSLRLDYYSERPGLAAFVVGLVKGLGRRFDTPVSVTLVRGRADGLDHDEFLVTMEGGGA